MKKTSILLVLTLISFFSIAQGWVGQLGGPGMLDRGFSVAVDASGNVYTTGNFEGTPDFDPGPGVYNLTPQYLYDLFISKLDANGNFVWAKNIGAAEGSSIAIDATGNVYVTGRMEGSNDYDPGPGTFILNSNGNHDVFILKLDAAGNFLWARNLGGVGPDLATAVAVDAAGNVYTTGSFSAIADFDPGAGTFNLASFGGNDIFVSKLDASGNFVWARQFGGAGIFDFGSSLVVDATGNTIVTGNFEGTTDFDPGVGFNNLTSAGSSDVFITKLDALGNLTWAQSFGGTGTDYSTDLDLNAAGDIHITGNFTGTVDFDPGVGITNLTAAGSSDVFVSKLATAGTLIWARTMGGILDDSGAGIDVDQFNNVYTVGAFQGTADFDPGAGVVNLVSDGLNDFFISKLDVSGNHVWVKRVGGTSTDLATSVFVDPVLNVHVTGYFDGTTDFDPGPGTLNLTATSSTFDIFVMKLNAFGTLPVKLLDFSITLKNNHVELNWRTAEEQNTSHFEIQKSSDGNSFKKLGDLTARGNSASGHAYSLKDPEQLNSKAFYRLKIFDIDGKFSFSRILSLKAESKGLQVYPNPVRDVLYLQLGKANENQLLQITDVTGKILHQEWKSAAASSITIDVANLSKGVYFITIRNGADRQVQSFIKE